MSLFRTWILGWSNLRDRLAASLLPIVTLLVLSGGSGQAALILNTNLIVNPGAEAGLAGWVPIGNTPELVAYGTPGFPSLADPGPPGRASSFFAGGPNNDFNGLSQTLDVSNAAALIDAGLVTYVLSAWQGGKGSQPANAAIGVYMFDAGGSVLFSNGTNYNNTAADRNNTTGLFFRPAPLGLIVPGTRSLTFEILFMQGADGIDHYSDGYIDNASFVASATAVPEPGSLSLAVVALMLLSGLSVWRSSDGRARGFCLTGRLREGRGCIWSSSSQPRLCRAGPTLQFAILVVLGIFGFSRSAEAQYRITWEDFSRTETQCSTVCTETRDVQGICYPPPAADPNGRPFCTVERRCVKWDDKCEQVRKRLPDSDLIDLRIQRKAVDPSVVLFVLETPPKIDWYKGITVPDGSGSQWTIWNGFWAPPGSSKKELRHHDEVSLWSHQVRNGQCLLFTKAGFLGWWRNSYFLCGLERLEPGSRVTFTWISD